MSNKLKEAAELRIRQIANASDWSGDMRVNMTTIIGALRVAIKIIDDERADRFKALTHESENIEEVNLASSMSNYMGE